MGEHVCSVVASVAHDLSGLHVGVLDVLHTRFVWSWGSGFAREDPIA